MTEKNDSYQNDIEDISIDKEYDDKEDDSDSYNEEEHFDWWLRYGRK